MAMINLALLIAAFVLFLLAAVGVPSSRFSLTAAGLACVVLTRILSAV